MENLGSLNKPFLQNYNGSLNIKKAALTYKITTSSIIFETISPLRSYILKATAHQKGNQVR